MKENRVTSATSPRTAFAKRLARGDLEFAAPFGFDVINADCPHLALERAVNHHLHWSEIVHLVLILWFVQNQAQRGPSSAV